MIKKNKQAPYVNANTDRFNGFAEKYDQYRPSVPKIVVDILNQLACISLPKKVIDIGCGTGLSTRIWSKNAEEVIGIEPNDDMRRQANSYTNNTNIHYLKGFSYSTELPDNEADIVTVVEAFHWMEPSTTLKEIDRILRPGGVFAAIDYDWPPTINLEAEALDIAFEDRVKGLLEESASDSAVRRWKKEEHLQRIQKSGYFKFTKEIAVHGTEKGNSERMIGLALNQSNIQILINKGDGEKAGLTKFCMNMKSLLGDKPQSMYFTYRIRLGVKS